MSNLLDNATVIKNEIEANISVCVLVCVLIAFYLATNLPRMAMGLNDSIADLSPGPAGLPLNQI